MKPAWKITLLLSLALAAPSLAQESPARVRTVAILVYEGVELLDFAGPGEVFSAARASDGSSFKVCTVAKEKQPVRSQGFVEIVPQYALADCPAADIVVVPGGSVPRGDAELQRWLAERSKQCEIVMSVCNGALLLASAGLLDGLEATTHHGSLASLVQLAPKTKVYTNRRFVDNGRILTSAGVSAGIDGALHVVERLLGKEAALETARYMEYDWRPGEIAKLHAEPGRSPDESPSARLASLAAGKSVEAAVAEYRALKEQPTEAQLNTAGYTLLGSGQPEKALALFRLVTALFPDSANAWDSLSEAQERHGDKQLAKEYAEAALERLKKKADLPQDRVARIRNASASRIARLGNADQSALRFECPPCGNTCDDVRYLELTVCPGCAMTLREAGSAGSQ